MQRLLVTVLTLVGLLFTSAATFADRDRHDWDRHDWDRRGHDRHLGYAPRHVHGSRTGVYLDIGPLWWPGYYPRYYPPYAPSTIVVNPAPTTYIQQPAAEGTGYWYYCPSSRTYYPYVKSCPEGWMKVVPETP